MNALIGFAALIAVGLVGWAIAEFKYKAFTFTRSEKDIEEEKELEEQKRAEGFKEMNIRDIMRKNSTNGYNAVGQYRLIYIYAYDTVYHHSNHIGGMRNVCRHLYLPLHQTSPRVQKLSMFRLPVCREMPKE